MEGIMKKIIMLAIFSFALIMLSSCALFSIQSGNGDSAFNNKTIQTAQEIKDKIDYYKTRLSSLIEQPSEIRKNLNKKLSTVLGPDRIIYQRDELPLEYDYPYDPDQVDSEFIFTKTMLLQEYKEAIDLCEDFEEDSFCTAKLEYDNIYLKVINEDDKLYIESYRYNIDYQSVNVEIIYIDLVDDKVQLQYVRDYYRKSGPYDTHDRYFDIFNESGDTVNIHVNMKREDEVYYQEYAKSIKSVFLFTKSEEGLGYNYTDAEQEKFYSISYYPSGEVQHNFLAYGIHNPTLIYSQGEFSSNQSIRLSWNLLDIDGWNQVIVNENNYDQVYLDDTELLTDFLTDISIQDHITARTSKFISEEQFTQETLALSAYGLSFKTITYQQLLNDRVYLANNYIDILEIYGFVEDMSENRIRLLAMFPFVGDEDIINDLFAQMES
jgi:hypothetical protein